jgi:hypothetical protein
MFTAFLSSNNKYFYKFHRIFFFLICNVFLKSEKHYLNSSTNKSDRHNITEILLKVALRKWHELIITGDFNFHLDENDSNSCTFLEILDEHGLSQHSDLYVFTKSSVVPTGFWSSDRFSKSLLNSQIWMS